MNNCISHDCPHCNSKKSTFVLLHDVETSLRGILTTAKFYDVFAQCRICNNTVIFLICYTNNASSPVQDKFFNEHNPPVTAYKCTPEKNDARIPPDCPENVELVFKEAEHAFASQLFSSAGACYRKAIERSLKHLDASLEGMLNRKIRSLEQRKIIPPIMIDLLDQVKLFGNASMHEDDYDPTEHDCAQAREFAYLFLYYSFTLPVMVNRAKNLES